VVREYFLQLARDFLVRWYLSTPIPYASRQDGLLD